MGRSTLHPSMLGNIRMSFMLYRREGEMAAVKARFLGLLRRSSMAATERSNAVILLLSATLSGGNASFWQKND